MPMLKRPIEPSSITRASEGKIPTSIRNELEYVANSTQANLIRQLSSLSQHAEDMFRELFDEATAIYNRTCHLTTKVDGLRESVQQFDPNQVVVKLTDITKKKPFKTQYHTDQQICTKQTMPRSLQLMYNQCAPPPRLDKFDRFRSDGKDSVKMYTNPDYFVQLWFESIQKNVTEASKKHDGKKIRKRPSKRATKKELGNVRGRAEKYQDMAQGKEFMPAKTQAQIAAEKEAEMRRQEQAQAPHRQTNISNGHVAEHRQESQSTRHPHQPPPAPPAPVQQGSSKADAYQDVVYDYGLMKPEQPSSQFPQPPQASQMLRAGDMTRGSVVSQSSSMQRMTMPPPPPPPSGSQGSGLPPPPSPPGHPDIGIVPPPPSMAGSEMGAIRPASPPPPPELQQSYIPAGVPPPPPPAPLSPQASYAPTPAGVPPPPPPPPPGPPMPAGGPPPPPPPDGMGLPPPPPAPPSQAGGGASAAALTMAAAGLKKTANIPKPEPVKDDRSDLLAQIRKGIQLRGAEESKKNDNANTLDSKKVMLGGTFDVQSIMDKVQAMRRHFEDSDSDSDDRSEWDEDEYYN